MATVHIIGAGLSGLAAASALARDGHYVQVYEASQAAGGRCKLLYDDEDNSGFDGCNALLFGANGHALRFAEALGSGHTFDRLDAGGVGFDTKAREYVKRPAFLMPPSAPLFDMAQLLGLAAAPRERTVGQVFDYYHPLTERYIEPLTRSLAFAAPEQTQARTFARRLGYLLRKGHAGARLMMPKHSLYHSLVAPALAQVESEDGAVYYGQQVKRLEFKDGRISGFDMLKQKKALREDDMVILALPAPVLASLMPKHFKAQTVETRDVVSVIYRVPELQEARLVPLQRGVSDWVKVQHGRVIVTCYAPRQLVQQENLSLARRLWREVAPMLGLSPNDVPEARVAKERKAVCMTTQRPEMPSNAVCAGESFAPEYLPPLEAAIASGHKAAHKIGIMIGR